MRHDKQLSVLTLCHPFVLVQEHLVPKQKNIKSPINNSSVSVIIKAKNKILDSLVSLFIDILNEMLANCKI